MRLFFLLLLVYYIVITPGLHAKLIKHEALVAKRIQSTVSEACQFLQVKEQILNSIKDNKNFECFNKSISVKEYCSKKVSSLTNEENLLLRGYADRDTKQIVCELGKSVQIKIKCDQRDKRFCLDKDKGCEELRDIFAQQLEVSQSILDTTENELACYFSKPIKGVINED